ncbi:MAG TPA: sulfatase-like hydrolase/transferase [Acidobacteriota bacterium]
MERVRARAALRRSAALSLPLLLAGLAPALPPRQGGGGAPRQPWNLVLITLDTLRTDHVGAYGSKRVATPALDRLAREGVLFTGAHCSTPLTLPSHTTLMTGLYPAAHGVHDNGGFFVQASQTLLAERLQQHGYHTLAVVGSFVLHSRWGIAQGFDVFRDDFEQPADSARFVDPLWLHKRGDRVLDEALNALGQAPREPFFLWVHFYDPHYPYLAPEPYASEYGSSSYEAEVAFTDTLVGELTEQLRRRGLERRTLLVAAADHGEGLSDHVESTHSVLIYQEIMHVPLIVRLPDGRFHGRRVDDVVRLADVVPTVLELLGLEPPAGLHGRSLVPLMRGQSLGAVPAYMESLYGRYHYGWSELLSLRTARYKLIRTTKPELYDLADDPGETRNLYGERPQVARDLEAHLDRVRQRIGASETPAEPAELDPETLAQLRALGYAGGTVQVEAGKPLPDPKDHIAKLDRVLVQTQNAWQAVHDQDWNRAAAVARQVLELQSSFTDAYHILGIAELALGRYPEAIRTLERGIGGGEAPPAMKLALSRAYVSNREPDAAERVLRDLMLSDPSYHPAQLALATLLAERKQLNAARALLEPLLEIEDAAGAAAAQLGLIELEQGRIEPAERLLRRAAASGDAVPDVHFNLALIAEGRGRQEAAAAAYRAELERFPQNDRAWQNLGLSLKGRGDLAGAAAAFEQVTKLRPQDPAGYYLLATVRAQQGADRQQVESLLRRCLELQPDYEPALKLLQPGGG